MLFTDATDDDALLRFPKYCYSPTLLSTFYYLLAPPMHQISTNNAHLIRSICHPLTLTLLAWLNTLSYPPSADYVPAQLRASLSCCWRVFLSGKTSAGQEIRENLPNRALGSSKYLEV